VEDVGLHAPACTQADAARESSAAVDAGLASRPAELLIDPAAPYGMDR